MENGEIKNREKRYFGSKDTLYWLKCLEDDSSLFKRMLINQFVLFWDKDLKYINPKIYKGKSVLDVGCGDLRYVSYFKNNGANFCVGFDLSKEFLNSGIKKRGRKVYDTIIEKLPDKLVEGDAEKMPFNAGSFDFLLLFHSIHHMPDKERVLKESYRVLKPGGHLVVSELNGNHPLRDLADDIGKEYKIMSYDERSMHPKRMTDLVKNAGFEIDYVKYFNAFSEPLFHIANIVGKKSWHAEHFLKSLLFLANPLDALLEATLLKIAPSLSWRYVMIAKKP
jgi:ubiquinone/menaquinone biosynthesis C-methylase UbiE